MRNRRKRIPERSGFTLVHAVVIVSVLPLIVVAATTWVHESMKMSNRFKHRRKTNVVLNHFSNEFRNDVHGCKSLKLNSDLNQIELTGHEDQEIVFQIQDGQINKTVTVDGEVVGRESFRLSDEYFAQWDPGGGIGSSHVEGFALSDAAKSFGPRVAGSARSKA